jgi:glycosyltransferase involved in cell wall biosynthesis
MAANPETILITVAICTRNRAVFLEQAIRSVLPQLAPDTELLVVNNASTDETHAVCGRLAEAGGAFGYVREPKLGLSVARNLALDKAGGKYVLFLDDDAIAQPGWLEAYRNFLAQPSASRIAVVGGVVIPFFDRPPPPWISKNRQFDFGNQPMMMPAGGLSGCNSAYHREAARAVGRFDERLGYQGNRLIPREESELQERLIKAGWECWWLSGAAVQHHAAAERLTINGIASSNYNAGRAAAIHRLKVAGTPRRRLALRLGRLLVVPFHIFVNLLQAMFLVVLGKQNQALGAWCRVARTAGLARQLMTLG